MTVRGHHRKIAAAVLALNERGLLLPHLRPSERDALIWLELSSQGYTGAQMPSRDSIRRHFARVREVRETRKAV